MSTSSTDSIFSVGTTQIAIPPGATLAVLIAGVAGQNSLLLKYGSGGTLYAMGVGDGATLTANQLALAPAHYLVGTSETLSFDGPARLYLASLSATTLVYGIYGRSQGV